MTQFISFLGGIALLVFFFIVMPIWGLHIDTGNGSQVGYVSAVERSGLFFKTDRVFIKPTLESTQEDVYCVLDPDAYKALETASVEKSRVRVDHFTWLVDGSLYCKGEPAIIKTVTVQ